MKKNKLLISFWDQIFNQRSLQSPKSKIKSEVIIITGAKDHD